ncbi:MAG: mechanosensitive ion channel family protein [Archangium sp.]|nr:mechanosensitive ion channel family protein [Archangium sp.]MDP3155794.1 mechanosensitive ion channel family protein [Archangium sp.]MDP3574036.1 mechanosensitive ion channel family protein [Archangium sp.]
MSFPSRSRTYLVAWVSMVWAAPALAQDAPDFGKLAEFVRWGGVAASVPILLAALFLLRVVENAGERLSARFSNRRPTIQKVQTVARFALYIIAFSLIISFSIRLDPTALTVIGGALAFAVGFALRDLVASFIAGITIMFDRPFQVGDRVTYGGEYGDVIQIGLRSVRVNTLDHNIITIPNNRVFTDVTSSGNYGALEMQVPMDFYVGTDQDVERAVELIREACLNSPYVFLARPIPVLAKQVIMQDYVAFHLKARPYVFDCQYEKPFETDVHFRVLQAFREHGIGPPAVLHRQLTPSAPKEG